MVANAFCDGGISELVEADAIEPAIADYMLEAREQYSLTGYRPNLEVQHVYSSDVLYASLDAPVLFQVMA